MRLFLLPCMIWVFVSLAGPAGTRGRMFRDSLAASLVASGKDAEKARAAGEAVGAYLEGRIAALGEAELGARLRWRLSSMQGSIPTLRKPRSPVSTRSRSSRCTPSIPATIFRGFERPC